MKEDRRARRIRVRTKMLLGFLAVVALMMVVTYVVVRQQSIIHNSLVQLERADTIERYLLECRRQEKNFLLRMDPASLELFTVNFDSLLHNTLEFQQAGTGRGLEAKLSALGDGIVEYGDAFAEIRASWFEEIGQEERDRLQNMTVGSARACHALVTEIRQASLRTFSDAHRMTHTVSYASIALGLALSVLLAGVLTRNIVVPLEYLRKLAERVSTGDIQDMDVEFSELEMRRFSSRETYDLARSLQRMVTSMRLLVSTEQGLMDDFHMTIVVLVNKAVGPGGRAMIEEAARAAGLKSFAGVKPDNVGRFVVELAKRAIMVIPKERVDLLSKAIGELKVNP